MAIRKLMTIKWSPGRVLARDLNQRPTGIELHQADTPNSHKGLITSRENDQQRPEPITYRSVRWELVSH